MTKLIQIIALIAMVGTPLIASSEVILNWSNGYPFYHIAHILRAGEFTTVHPEEFLDPRLPEITGQGKCASNGYFEVFISKAHFPIKAPNCKSKWLRATMRGCSPEQSGAEGKKALWDQIRSVETGELDEVMVIIELNPYLTIIETNPLKIELDYCNVQFRTAWGEYIPHLEKLH